MDYSAKHANFVSRAIELAEMQLRVADGIDDLRREWDELGLSGGLVPNAFAGDNAHVAIANLADLAAFQEALSALMTSGHRAKLLAFKR